MNDYANAWDALVSAIASDKGSTTGYFNEVDHLTTDQRIEAAKVAAILSVSQEISGLRDDLNHRPE